MSTPRYRFTTRHFRAGESLRNLAGICANRLLSHHHRVLSVGLQVERENSSRDTAFFVATATLDRRGQNDVVRAEAPTPEEAVHVVIQKAERVCRDHATVRKHAVHHPHAVELAANLPKV